MWARILGVFKLDSKTFEEIEHNTDLTGQAAIIVILVALVSGLGSGLFAGASQVPFFQGFLGTLLSVVLGWLVWAAATQFAGTRFFGGKADLGEMLRVIGFATLPQLLGIIPCFGRIIGLVWTLLAVFVAVRQGLDIDNKKTILTIIIGFILVVLLELVLGMVFGSARSVLGLF
jgi:hypothetical protein